MEPYVVGYVPFFEVKLIDANGVFYNSINIKKAKEMAKEVELDLVCFNNPSKDTLALCKIINYGKYKYHLEKSKKKEKRIEAKEIWFTPVISEHDIEHKVNQIIGFLEKRHEVIIVMKFKGIHHRMLAEGERIVNLIVEKCSSISKEVSRKKTADNICVKLSKQNGNKQEIITKIGE